MSGWACPNCHGGFPEPVGNSDERGSCPWCGESIDGAYEPELPMSISRIESDGDDPQTPLQKVKEWLQ